MDTFVQFKNIILLHLYVPTLSSWSSHPTKIANFLIVNIYFAWDSTKQIFILFQLIFAENMFTEIILHKNPGSNLKTAHVIFQDTASALVNIQRGVHCLAHNYAFAQKPWALLLRVCLCFKLKLLRLRKNMRTYTVWIWIPTIWIPETFEYQTFWSIEFQMVGWSNGQSMSYVLCIRMTREVR